MAEQENGTNIAYFAVHRTQDNQGYIGGMLVIDDRGVPQEFRCTVPIRPTNVQKALYGGTLEPYMFSELIGVPLVGALTTPPKCFLVERGMLLELREQIEMPVLYLEKYGEALSSDSGKTTQSGLVSRQGGFQSLTASSHPSYATDYESVREVLEHIFDQVDLLEPFDRISRSLKVLSERDTRFK